MTRATVGKIASDLMEKPLETTSPIEQMQEQLTDYDANLMECISRSKCDFVGDFYVLVITKRERLMPNVFRNYFFSRVSCPTPEWDQTVYLYHRKDERIEFLWVIPSKDTCETVMMNKNLVPPSEMDLLRFIIAYYDNTLLKFAKKLNGEKEDSVELKDFTFKG
jgi:hypothetical protein